MPQVSTQRHFGSLAASIWRALVWCAMIGGGIGLVSGLVRLIQKSAGGFDVVSGVIVGVAMGMILLGIPASLWVFIAWVIRGDKPSSTSIQPTVAQGAGHGAIVGSRAAIPGAILGGLGGAAIGMVCLAFLGLMEMLLAMPWYREVVHGWLWQWYGWFTGVGAVIGFFAGLFLGSAIGAIFGGARRVHITTSSSL